MPYYKFFYFLDRFFCFLRVKCDDDYDEDKETDGDADGAEATKEKATK